ncbi:hypothetical protein [Acinetobacter sp.]|uniref:hypothetical protein n=1 Tax=Acinetobacter sp. TaxID=472 RepID=UPI0025C7184F|nr:hypothetical protein [Acinetobacter sp.]
MYQLQLKKFRKNPELIDEINAQGGLEFIKQSSHIVGVKNSRWEGKGLESNFIKVLAKSYETVAKELGKFVEIQSSKPIVAYGTRGNNFLEALEKDNAIGNPFSHLGSGQTTQLTLENVLKEYTIEQLTHGVTLRSLQNKVKEKDFETIKRAYNYLKSEEKYRSIRNNNEIINSKLEELRNKLAQTKETKVGSILTITNEENASDYKVKVLEINRYSDYAILKVKTAKNKEYTIKVNEDGTTKTGIIEDFIFKGSDENVEVLKEEINNLKSQLQELKSDYSDYYIDYFESQNDKNQYGLYKTNTVKEATEEFIAWMIGEKHTDKLQDYRQAIIDKIPEMRGKTILYYKDLEEPSHATALDYLINKYDWNKEKTKLPTSATLKQAILKLSTPAEKTFRSNVTAEHIQNIKSQLQSLVQQAVDNPTTEFTTEFGNPNYQSKIDERGLRPTDYAVLMDEIRLEMGESFPKNIKFHPAFELEMNNSPVRLAKIYADRVNTLISERGELFYDQNKLLQALGRIEITLDTKTFSQKHGPGSQQDVVNTMAMYFYTLMNKQQGIYKPQIVPMILGELLKTFKSKALTNELYADVVKSFSYNSAEPKLSFLDIFFTRLSYMGYRIDTNSKNLLKNYFNDKKNDSEFVSTGNLTLNLIESENWEQSYEDFLGDVIDEINFDDTRGALLQNWWDSNFEKNFKDKATFRLKMFIAGQKAMESFSVQVLPYNEGVPMAPDAIDITDSLETVTLKQLKEWNKKKVFHKTMSPTQVEESLQRFKGRVPKLNSLGYPEPVNFDSVYEKTLGVLANSTNLDTTKIIKKLRESGDADLMYLADRIDNTSSNYELAKQEELLQEFQKVMDLQYGKFLLVRGRQRRGTKENKGSNWTEVRVINSQRYQQQQTIIRKWKENQALSPSVKTLPGGEKVLNKELAAIHDELVTWLATLSKPGTPDYVIGLTNLSAEAKQYIQKLGVDPIKIQLQEANKVVPKDFQRTELKKLMHAMFQSYGIDFSPEALNDLLGYYPTSKGFVDTISSIGKSSNFDGSLFTQFGTTVNDQPGGVFKAFFSAFKKVKESETDFEDNILSILGNPLDTENTSMNIFASIEGRHAQNLYNKVHRSTEGKQIFDYGLPTTLSKLVLEFQGIDGDFEFRNNLLKSVWGNNPYLHLQGASKIDLASLDGLNIGASDGIVRQDMSDREQALTAIYLYQNQGRNVANMLSLTHSDKPTSPIFTNVPKLNDKDVVAGFKTLLQSEFKRIEKVQELIKENGTTGNFAMDKNGSSFMLFTFLNKEELSSGDKALLYNPDGTIKSLLTLKTEGTYTRVEELLNKFLNSEVTKTLSYWKELELTPELMDHSYVKKLRKVVNGRHENVLQNEVLDVAAREYSLNTLLWNMSSAVLFFGDPANAANKGTVEKTLAEYAKRTAKDIAPGYQLAFKSPKYTQLTIADVTMLYDYIEKSGGTIKDSVATDAQEVITVQEKLDFMYAEGKISAAKKKSIEDTLKADKDLDSEDVELIMGADKPVYAGPRFENGLIHYDYIKTSAYTLLPQLTRNLAIDKLRLLLEGKLVKGYSSPRATFTSGSKLGNQTKLGVTLFTANNQFVSPSLEDLNKNTRTLQRKFLRVQQEVPIDVEKDQINLVTQMDKLIVEGLSFLPETTKFKVGDTEMNPKEVRAFKEKTRTMMGQYNLKKLYEKLGVVEGGKIPAHKVIKFLIETARQGEYKPNELALLESLATEFVTDVNGVQKEISVSSIPIFFQGASVKLEKLLLSQVKKVVQFKVPGKSYVQGSSIGFVRDSIVTEETLTDSQRKGIVYVPGYSAEEPLKHMRIEIENGKEVVKPAQVLMPFHFFINGVKQKITDYIVDGKLDTSKLPEEFLQAIGARIPNQGHSSMIAMEVVGFLPEMLGDLIIVPSAITGQMGSDFDVDKLYVYRRPIQDENEEVDKLQKDYFNIHWGILTHTEMYKRIMSPLDKDDLTQANKLYAKSDKDSPNFFSAITQLKLFQSGKDAKALVGMAALASTGNSNFQNKSLRLGTYLITKDGVEEMPTPIKLNGITFTHISGNESYVNKDKEYSKGVNINIDLSGAVDNAKNRNLDNLNISIATYPVFDALNNLENETGELLDKKFMVGLLVQDIIEDYTKLFRKQNDSFSEDFTQDVHTQVVRELKSKYLKKAKADGHKIEEQEIFETEMDQNMLEALFNDSLNSGTKSKLYYIRQLAVLENFDELHKYGKRLAELRKTFNQDTRGPGPNIIYVLQQVENRDNLFNKTGSKVFLDEDSLYEGQQKELFQLVIPTALNLMSSVYPIETIKNLMSSIAGLQGKAMTDLGLKSQQKILNSFKSAIISNSPLIFGTNTIDPKVAHGLATVSRFELLYGAKGKESLGKRLVRLRKLNPTNSYLQSLEVTFGLQSTDADKINYHFQPSARLSDNDVVADFQSLFTSTNKDLRQLGEDLMRYSLLLSPQAGPNSYANIIPAGILTSSAHAVYLRQQLNTMLSEDYEIPVNLITQIIQHNPSLAVEIKTEKIKEINNPIFEIPDRDYPEVISTERGKASAIELPSKDLPTFLRTRSKMENKPILYRLMFDNGTVVTYARIDTLGENKVTQYDLSVNAARSLFPNERAGIALGDLSISTTPDTEVDRMIHKNSSSDNSLSRWNNGVEETDEEGLLKVLQNLSIDRSVPTYLRVLAEQLSENTNNINNLATEVLGVTAPLQVKFGDRWSFKVKTNQLILGKTSSISKGAELLVHEVLHQRSSALLTLLGWRSKTELLKIYKDSVGANFSLESFEKLWNNYVEKTTEFTLNNFEASKKALALNRLRQQALKTFEQRLKDSGVDVEQIKKDVENEEITSANHSLYYSMSSMFEFVVQVQTNKDLMKYLNSVESGMSQSWIKNLTDAFLEFLTSVLDFLGESLNSNSILKESLALSYSLTQPSNSTSLIYEGNTLAKQTFKVDTELDAAIVYSVATDLYKQRATLIQEDLNFIVDIEDKALPRTDYIDNFLRQFKSQINMLGNKLNMNVSSEEDKIKKAEFRKLYLEALEDYEIIENSNEVTKVLEVGESQLAWVNNLITNPQTVGMAHLSVAYKILNTWKSLSEIYKTPFNTLTPEQEELKKRTDLLEIKAQQLFNIAVQKGIRSVASTSKEDVGFSVSFAELSDMIEDPGIIQKSLIAFERDGQKISQLITTFTQYHIENKKGEYRNLIKDLKRAQSLLTNPGDSLKLIQESKDGDVWGLVQNLSPEWFKFISSTRKTLSNTFYAIRKSDKSIQKKSLDYKRAIQKFWSDVEKRSTVLPIDKLLDKETGELLTTPEATALLQQLKDSHGETIVLDLLDKAQLSYKRYVEQRNLRFKEFDIDPMFRASAPAEELRRFNNMSPENQLQYLKNLAAKRKRDYEFQYSPMSFLSTMDKQTTLNNYYNRKSVNVWLLPNKDDDNFDPKYAALHAPGNEKLLEAYNIFNKWSKILRSYLPSNLESKLHDNFLPVVLLEDLAEVTDFIDNFKTGTIKQKIASKTTVSAWEKDRIKSKKISLKYATNKVPKDSDNKVDLQAISTNLPRIFEMFGDMVLQYKHLSPVQEYFDVIKTLLNAEHLNRLNTGKKGLNNLIELLEYYEDTQVFKVAKDIQGLSKTPIYDINPREDKKIKERLKNLNKSLEEKKKLLNEIDLFAFDITDEVEREAVSQERMVAMDKLLAEIKTLEKSIEAISKTARYYAGSKVGDTLIGIQQLKSMAWNPFSAVANVSFNFLAAKLHARGFRADKDGFTKGDFTNAQLNTAYKLMLKLLGAPGGDIAKKIRTLIERVGAIESLIDTRFGDSNLKEEKSNTRKFLDPYAAQRSGDWLTKGAVIIARALNTPVKVMIDGNETTISLFEALDNNANFNTEKYGENEWSNPKSWSTWNWKTRKIMLLIFGNQDRDVPLYLRKGILGRLIGQFRLSWLPEAFKVRWGNKLPYDEILEREVEGRYRTMGRLPMLGVPLLLKQALSVVTGNNPFEDQMIEDIDASGTVIERKMRDFEIENMRRNLAGLSYSMLILAMYYMLKSALPDEDEMKRRRRRGESSWGLRMTSNMLYRLHQDLSLYSDPSQFNQLIGNPVPASAVIVDVLKAGKAWKKFMLEEDYTGEQLLKAQARAIPFVNLYPKIEYWTSKNLASSQR